MVEKVDRNSLPSIQNKPIIADKNKPIATDKKVENLVRNSNHSGNQVYSNNNLPSNNLFSQQQPKKQISNNPTPNYFNDNNKVNINKPEQINKLNLHKAKSDNLTSNEQNQIINQIVAKNEKNIKKENDFVCKNERK